MGRDVWKNTALTGFCVRVAGGCSASSTQASSAADRSSSGFASAGSMPSADTALSAEVNFADGAQVEGFDVVVAQMAPGTAGSQTLASLVAPCTEKADGNATASANHHTAATSGKREGVLNTEVDTLDQSGQSFATQSYLMARGPVLVIVRASAGIDPGSPASTWDPMLLELVKRRLDDVLGKLDGLLPS